MKKSWGLIPKILSGEKTIESRWYQTRRAPWGKIQIGDIVYFKNSGEPIIASAKVSKVLQFSIHQPSDITHIIAQYGKQICLIHRNPATWSPKPNYCILIFLVKAEPVQPFSINKSGFGNAAAWLCVEDVRTIEQQTFPEGTPLVCQRSPLWKK